MIIETLAILGLILGAAACLSLASIREWLRGRTATRYGDLIKRDMQNGNVEIIAIGLTASGRRTGEKTWKAKSMDAELAATFGSGNRVRVSV
jgi:hypothetical protein